MQRILTNQKEYAIPIFSSFPKERWADDNMQIITIILGSLALIILMISIILWFLTVKSQSPQKTEGGAKPQFPYELVTFMSNGTLMSGWIISNQTKEKPGRKPIVILAHGWGSSKSRMLRYVEPLYKEGYDLFLFDARSHGESGTITAPTVKSFRDDVLAAVQFAAQRQETDPDRIAVLAHSFGGFGSVLALQQTNRIKALVTDSMPARFDTIMKAYLSKSFLKELPITYFLLKIGFWRAGIKKKEVKGFDPVPVLKQTKTPVLLLHSKRDDYVPVAEMDYLISQVPGIEHRHLNVLGHRNSHKDSFFWITVLPFFRKHLQFK